MEYIKPWGDGLLNNNGEDGMDSLVDCGAIQ